MKIQLPGTMVQISFDDMLGEMESVIKSNLLDMAFNTYAELCDDLQVMCTENNTKNMTEENIWKRRHSSKL